jgi:hypothetical protein
VGPRPARASDRPEVHAAERRALDYLAREVPRWARENHCYSCHNNGDAARALLEATHRRFALPPEALADTLAFLSRPGSWDKNGVDSVFSDKRLARLQFTGALAAAIEAGSSNDRAALVEAARGVARDQSADGSWPIDELALIGSPATYGQRLATVMSRRALAAADPAGFAQAIARADGWLRAQPVRNVVEAAAVLLVFGPGNPADAGLRRQATDLLRKAQTSEGGWGPFVNAPPEAFDTALALIALSQQPVAADLEPLIARGRRYLVATQANDGSWQETTRPAGAESYAQRLSTTGWAALALMTSAR